MTRSDLPGDEWVHENDAVKAFAQRMAGPGITYDPNPEEGKINFFRRQEPGMLSIDLDALSRFNLSPDVMLATRHDGSLMPKGKGVARNPGHSACIFPAKSSAAP